VIRGSVSQTLMQCFTAAAGAAAVAFLRRGTGALVVLVPVLVMAAGQLAGGLAWLAISGEDAPDLVATAPIRAPMSCGRKSKPCSAVSPSRSRHSSWRWRSCRFTER